MPRLPLSVRILVDRRPTNLRVGKKDTASYFADVVMCVDATSGSVLGAEMLHPATGDAKIVALAERALDLVRARAPGAQVMWVARQERVAGALAGAFRGQVLLESGESFAPWDEAYLAMDRDLAGGGGMVGYLGHQDVTVEEVAALFEEAAAYYRLRPWQFLDDSQLLGKPSPIPGEPSLLISVLGASGVTRGLALFDSEEHFDAMMSDRGHDGVVYISFERRNQVPHTVVAEIEEQGWRVAGRAAFPMLMRVREGEAVPWSGDDLRRVTAALHALNEVTRAYREAAKTPRKR
jgi:hypothetical protein